MKDILNSPLVRDAVTTAITTIVLCVAGYFKKKTDLKKLRKSGKLKD